MEKAVGGGGGEAGAEGTGGPFQRCASEPSPTPHRQSPFTNPSGPGVLPTGRNIHALDPYRMPSAAALARGSAAADAILAAHRAANDGAWPETVAVNLWGLDAIKTRGESVATVLRLVGAAPVAEGTGRVARFELLPLADLGGRPRIDVLCNMSGIFRDSFQNVVDLLDDMFARAADADEPPERNYIRKHALAIAATGAARPAARLFSNPAGDYGSMVGERVGAGNWEAGDELGDTWASRNSFSYGRGGERGAARPEVLQALLATTDRVVQQARTGGVGGGCGGRGGRPRLATSNRPHQSNPHPTPFPRPKRSTLWSMA